MITGGAICGSFVVFGVISAILYRPWRRRVDAKRNALVGPSDESDLETRDNNTEGIHGEPELVQERPSTQHVHADRKGDCVV